MHNKKWDTTCVQCINRLNFLRVLVSVQWNYLYKKKSSLLNIFLCKGQIFVWKGKFQGLSYPSLLKGQIFHAKAHVNCAKNSTHHHWPKEDGSRLYPGLNKQDQYSESKNLRLYFVTVFVFYFQKLVFGNIKKKLFSCIFEIKNMLG